MLCLSEVPLACNSMCCLPEIPDPHCGLPAEQTGPQQHALPARELDWDAILAREQELAAIPAPSDSSQTSAEEPALMPGLQQIPGDLCRQPQGAAFLLSEL